MSRPAFRAALIVCLPLIAAGPAVAATALSTPDFVKKTAISDMFEVETGKLAADQGESSEVKSFGQQMVTDHTKTTNELKDLLKQHDIKAEVPAALDSEHQSELDSLKKLKGPEFDRTYVPEQVKAHQQAVDMFEGYASGGDNEPLKQWAQSTLPALQKHLQHAQSLQEELGNAPAIAEGAGAGSRQALVRNPEAKDREKQETAASAGTVNYVMRQQPTDWTAQALIGRSVLNPDEETLGEINNIILNEQGDVVAVTIGVGGFLGIGQKDVGVPFSALEFKPEAVAERQAEPKTGQDATGLAANRDSEDAAEEAQEAREEAREARYDSEHENMRIVLNATREQLEKAPDFVWLDEQDGPRAGGERVLR